MLAGVNLAPPGDSHTRKGGFKGLDLSSLLELLQLLRSPHDLVV
jgi:hypothetical protein